MLRDIASVPLFPDQLMHQVLINAARTVFERSFYKYSNGSIPKRGTHKGVRQIKRYIKRHRKSADIKYCANGVISAQEAEGFLSRIGALRHCDSKNFYLKHVKPYVNIKKLKEVVRYESRKQLETQRGV